MDRTPNRYLMTAAALSGAAALAHVGCIIFGGSWYRVLGAGEHMAQLDLAGHWYPKTITSIIALILSIWSLYALSGAGVVRKLPFVRLVLCVVTGIFLLRAIAFVPLQTYIPGNSTTFWLVSSGICFVIGAVHFIGLRQVWSHF